MPKAAYVAAPIAFLATASAVTLGVLASNPGTRDLIGAQDAAASISATRESVVSRSDSRLDAPVDGQTLHRALGVDLSPAATAQAVREADTKLWTTTALNLWTSPTGDATEVGEIDAGKPVLVTGRDALGRDEVVVDGEALWVTQGYLSDEKPVTGPSGDVDASCTNGSSVPSGVSPNIVAVHQAVCANFPELTSYGTFRGDGEHAQGLAIDIMVSGERGWEVAEFVRANYDELGVNYIIYSQNIWSVDRSSEGWRGLEDRGSDTANHYDHVHVTTY